MYWNVNFRIKSTGIKSNVLFMHMTKSRILRQFGNNGGRVNQSNSQAKQSYELNFKVYRFITQCVRSIFECIFYTRFELFKYNRKFNVLVYLSQNFVRMVRYIIFEYVIINIHYLLY